jgi:tRNA pseudouridine55 synthase
VPPAYSALKIDGKPAYARARAGEAVEMQPRRVTVHELRLLAATNDEATFAATVSKGTYIRSLARDLAHALNSVGHVTMLRRTRAGPFGLEGAISLDKLAEIAKARTLDGAVLPLDAGLDDIPALPVSPDQAMLLRHGQHLTGTPAKPGLHLAMDGTTPVALVEVSAGDVRVVRGFNL